MSKFKKNLLQKARENKEKNEKVLSLIPEKYHHYVMVLEHSTIFARKALQLDEELVAAGYYVNVDKKTGNEYTYLKVSNYYLTVAGKNALLFDWAEQNNYRFSIDNEVVIIGQKPFIKTVITVMGDNNEVIRKASSTVPVNVGGYGVDATNPYENAETSAVGRALTFLGMGQMGSIASYEEVVDAQKREKQIQKNKNEKEKEEAFEEGFIVDSFNFKDETKTAGFVSLTDPSSGEMSKIAGWGKIWKNLSKKSPKGTLLPFQQKPLKCKTIALEEG